MLEKSSSLSSVLSKVATTAFCNPRDQWFHGFHSYLVGKLCQWLLSCMFTEISPCVMILSFETFLKYELIPCCVFILV